LSELLPFKPDAGATVNITVSAASQSIQVSPILGNSTIRAFNNGTATVWVAFGPTGLVVTTANGMPIGPGQSICVTVDNHVVAQFAAVIAAGATGIVYFTPGIGR
jgi:hypothetical protein